MVEGDNAEPQCDLSVVRPRVVVTINIDSAPQAYFRMERTIEELAQQFTVNGPNHSPPTEVAHLGIDASWLPDESELMTTDARRLITVGVAWPGHRRPAEIALATAEARLYLGPNDAKLAYMSP